MKNLMLFAALAAAFLFASCSKEAPANDSGSVALRTVEFSTLPTRTRTVFGDKSGSKYPVLWQQGDEICPSFNYASPSSSNYITVTPSADGASASFKGEVAEADSYRFMFVSPAVRFKSINSTNKTVMVEFPSGQASTAASPDPSAQILYADTGVMTEIPSPVELEFSHLAAYLHLQFANVDLGAATVQAVNVTNDARHLAGRVFYNWENDSFEASTEFKTISVSTNTLTDVWCAVCPVDLSAGKLTIEVVTDKGTLTKEVNMPASANLPRGKIGKFTVDMTGVPLVSPVVYNAVTSVDQLHVGDKVIIAAANLEEAYAMSTGQNTNNRSAAGVTKTAETILNPTDAVEIIELEDGVIPGHFAFKATGTAGYLYAGNQASSGSNILKTKDSKDNSASWEVKVQDVTQGGVTWEGASYIFADIPSSGRGLLAFNATDKLFAAYGAGTSMQAVKLYRLDAPVDNTPRFNVTLPEGNTYDNSTREIPVYVFGNVAWTASVTGGATLSANEGTGNSILTLTLPEHSFTKEIDPFTLTISTDAEVEESSFEFTINFIKPIEVGDVLFHELYWTGSEHNQTLADYQASGKATTAVYGGVDVTYTQDETSHFFVWPGANNDAGNVFLPTGGYTGELSTEGMEVNFRIQKNGGWLQVAGIPCTGVKKATLSYKINRDGAAYSPSSDTEGVAVGSQTRIKGTSDWGKTLYDCSYPLSFDQGLTHFNIKITDTHASNHVYIADIKVVVTEIY
ncbi:MAG: hypothetical protein J6T35_03205 [Bacteroidales bacterium]|nr:hypothetical protein [Bacteroidales bacterium]